jgi:hypothetical protein
MRMTIVGISSEVLVPTIIGIVFAVLASLIAALNLTGTYQAIQRQRKGDPRGYSSVPLFSLMLSLGALGLLYKSIGYWALLPAALDPGTWSIFILPFYLVWRVISGR